MSPQEYIFKMLAREGDCWHKRVHQGDVLCWDSDPSALFNALCEFEGLEVEDGL